METGDAVNPPIVAGGVPALTVTVAELGALVPPAPVQVSVYVTVPAAASGPSVVFALDVPRVDRSHPSVSVPPVPVHEVALVVVQARVTDCPIWTADGVAVNEVIVAAGGPELTFTVTDNGALAPPGPLQVSVYVYVPACVNGPIAVPRLAGGSVVPAQPSDPVPPVAAHEVALTVDHVSVVDCPTCSDAGVARKVPIVGAGVAAPTVIVTELAELVPPGPVQLRVYV